MKTRAAVLYSSVRSATGLLILCIAAWSVQGQGNLLRNGSFEEGWSNGPIGWGWTYNVGQASGFSGAADGRNWADVFGTLYQDLPTEPGQLYRLSFAMAGNFNIAELTVMNVLWGGSMVGTFTWNPAGRDINNLGWVYGDIEAVASASNTRLTFENPFVGTQTIIRLDAVEVTLVPEPSGFILFTLGALGLLVVRRTRPRMILRGPPNKTVQRA
jgi:hypothetical protein